MLEDRELFKEDKSMQKWQKQLLDNLEKQGGERPLAERSAP